MTYLNLSAYKFVSLNPNELLDLRDKLSQQALKYGIKGTLLLSVEGINLFIAADPFSANLFMAELCSIAEFSNLCFKQSESKRLPFKRMVVKIKKEIITMKQSAIRPETIPAPYIEPGQLNLWYEQNKNMIILDTRNNYEFEVGSFDRATHLNTENFSDFPEMVASLPEAWKTKPIVTFCTGGIRCEKAAAYLLSQGFEDVWQLKGGILNYFEQYGDQYFHGNCFVFDDRFAVDANLKEIS